VTRVTVKIEPSAAVNDVLVERVRQLSEEGYDAAHDDAHSDGTLAQAAACYAANASEFWHRGYGGRPYWPFDEEYWKPKDKRRDLVRAGALILAEIERIDRATEAVA
jgi:hypothetical protein